MTGKIQIIHRHFFFYFHGLICRIFVMKITSDRASVNRFSSCQSYYRLDETFYIFLDNQNLARFDM